MATSRAKTLESIALFSGLSKGDRELLARHLDELSFEAGTSLIQQGATNHTFFVLIQGEADVTVSGEPRRTLRGGDFFGEISMDRRVPATASIVARTPVDALVMSHDQFRAVQGSPQVLARLRAAINDRLAADRLKSG